MDDIAKNSILVVDDEKTNLVFLTRILGEKYAIYTAKDGASGLRKASELVPDLIMLDILMPDMSGYEVLNELKKHETTRDIPVIFITAMNSDDEEEKALSYNAVDYINKPFKPNVVILRVRNQIRIVNQMRTIERLSMTDQLTEIPNRRSFDSRLNMEWRRAIREKKPISLLMLDIDKFKNFNDTYGHQQGDNVLRAVAKSLVNDMMRPGDFAARWGGEEFCAVLGSTGLDDAVQVAERIRGNIENLRIAVSGTSGEVPVTISIGVESIMPDQESSLDLFISTADNALYAAKRAGRNRVCTAGKG